MKKYSIDGFVIVDPISPWDEKNKELIWTGLGHKTFSLTASGAWMRHSGMPVYDSMKVNRWIDGGYRLKKATLIIEDNDDEVFADT